MEPGSDGLLARPLKTTARLLATLYLSAGVPLALLLTDITTFAQTNPPAARFAMQTTSQSSFVLDAQGGLYGWNDNQHGQLGLGVQSTNLHSFEPSPRSVPLPAGVAQWIAVASGTFHTLAIGDNGKLYACGANNLGQLGIPGSGDELSFTLVQAPGDVTNWLAVAAGDHSLGLAEDGRLYAWGQNYDGQLGLGNRNNQSTPQLVPFPTGVKRWRSIAAGEEHTLAIADTGVLYACGGNYYGELGISNNLNQAQAMAVVFPPGVSSWRSVAASFNFTLAVGDNGLIYGWGLNSGGQLGNGTLTNSNIPLPVSLPPGVAEWAKITAAGGEGFALASSGDLYSWGENYWGECGLGFRGTQSLPARVPLPIGGNVWADVAGGRGQALGLGTDCRVYEWGLPFGQTNPLTSPALVAGLETLCTAPSNASPVVSISNPTNGSILFAPSPILLEATATDPDGSISQLQFFDGNKLLGNSVLSGPAYSMVWSNASVGRHVLTARATDNLGLTAISTPIVITFANSNLNTVTLSVLDGAASEIGPRSGICLLTRNGNLAASLPVLFTLSGTAINGLDYVGLNYTYLSNLVVMPAGTASAQLGIRPLADDLIEGDETVIFTLTDSSAYNVGPQNQAIITITDNQTGISNQTPFLSLIAPGEGRLYSAPASVDLRAIIKVPAPPGAIVEFLQGTNSLGTSANFSVNPATNLFRLGWTNVLPGAYALSCQTLDTNGALVVSLPRHINVLGSTNIPSVGISRGANGNALTQVLVNGQPDGLYTIEYSTNMVVWQALTTATSSNGVIRFTDSQAAPGNRHFYRAVIVP